MTSRGRLRRLDDSVLGNRWRRQEAAVTVPDRPRRGTAAVSDVLAIVWRVTKLVFVVLAVVVLLGIVFTKTPTNAHNVIVRSSLQLARDAAGPFRDVFVSKSRQSSLVENYALAAAVYLLLAYLVGKLPTGRTRAG